MTKSPLSRLGPGTYIFILQLKREELIRIGRLGEFHFPAGYHAYVGSALGPGGLESRLARYLKPPHKPHWHIDYLRKKGEPVEFWIMEWKSRREHVWASLLRQLNISAGLVHGFGCSDCTCPTHLFHFQERPPHAAFRRLHLKAFPTDPKIQRKRIAFAFSPHWTSGRRSVKIPRHSTTAGSSSCDKKGLLNGAKEKAQYVQAHQRCSRKSHDDCDGHSWSCG